MVDDEPSSCKYICEAVEHEGYEPIAFASVSDCLNGLPAATHEEKPLAMIIDVMMPEADGIDLMRGLAEIKSSIPIIITSARGEFYIRAAQRLGTVWNLPIAATFTKPINHASLGLVLEKLSQVQSGHSQ